ncbi:MAG: MgtC/SapB family protein [Parcubacteria group bacterium]
METIEIIKQLLLALILGGVVGYERERSHKTAGMRTHALIALGAALLTMLSVYGFTDVPNAEYADPTRIMSNIVVGIGFIGGGVILKRGSHVRGITTAATLFTVAIIGITVGLLFNVIAIATTVIVYLVLSFMWRLERKMDTSRHYGDTPEEIQTGQQDEDESVHRH